MNCKLKILKVKTAKGNNKLVLLIIVLIMMIQHFLLHLALIKQAQDLEKKFN